jgi:heat shock protein HslJ
MNNILYLLLFITMSSCSRKSPANVTSIEGTYTLVGIFLSDAHDTPCGYETHGHEAITLIVGSQNKINGKATVNNYSCNATWGEYDAKTKIGTLSLSDIVSTKMAGNAEHMECEQRYFAFLKEAKEYRVIKNKGKDVLQIGNFRKATSHPRDGGTYLVFEKNK